MFEIAIFHNPYKFLISNQAVVQYQYFHKLVLSVKIRIKLGNVKILSEPNDVESVEIPHVNLSGIVLGDTMIGHGFCFDFLIFNN